MKLSAEELARVRQYHIPGEVCYCGEGPPCLIGQMLGTIDALTLEVERLRTALTNADHAPDCPVTLIPGDISPEMDGRYLECTCLVGELWDAVVGTDRKEAGVFKGGNP